MTEKYLLPLVDGGIREILTDTTSYGGCETCDYGSSYINEFTVLMTQGNIEIKCDQMYEYALSEGYMMQLILPNVDTIKEMTERELFQWLQQKMIEFDRSSGTVDITVVWKEIG
ncbi:hypothetical protein M5X00_26055 [Paenibacillus alvei]|uniref:hypothetical protein n=1 Tax=Paenibacillus alvei TaxID=44250 RepID=UPI002280B69E|nr:hypothetical protein [Paenibacillus alvei]MCY9757695.1 hypothetical protein [Paenibacillus alvei]